MFEIFRRDEVINNVAKGISFKDLGHDHLNDKDIAWFDLHVSPSAYKLPDPLEQEPWRAFEKVRNGGSRFVTIRPGESLILQTHQIIKTASDITGIVVGSAGSSIRGLSVTSGKVDPNFGPQSLAVNVYNGSQRDIYINDGDKIAVVGFIKTSRPVDNEKVVGPAKAAEDFLPEWIYRVFAKIKSFFRRYRSLSIWSVILYIVILLTQAQVRSWADSVWGWISGFWNVP
ncbi:hypothetical protein NOJ28_07490 [Neorhizobium galegae]|uniref:hypothetical protein n=1 Tax=Neorhizobium galegae TaxID=399 RepID=UPI0006214855|nr:hypothetical protein [Neorhizobium galegae]MCQ1765366.1 hypothetical protein [Neorhizobium galegae]MCQ1844280.1 hypothetical protein [Neorhizobium galegae]CDZ33364.1 Hypothetical protein NGAL_HAMBI1146_03390 [Neorhizobium galegae bv. officinalis]